MKNFIVIAVLIFTGILTVKAQFGISDLEDVYSVDQEIPSYFFPSSKNADNRRKAPVRGERNILERLLSLNDKTTAVLVDTLTDFAGGFHVSYAEYYEGIEVEGARCTIHYDKEGKITSVNGNFRTINELNIAPAISEEAALQYALADIGAEKYAWEDCTSEQMLRIIKDDQTATSYPKGTLVIYTIAENISLAYKFYVKSVDPVSYNYIYINAENGNVLGKHKANCELSATTTVTTRFSGQRTITTDHCWGEYRLRDYSRGDGILTYDFSSESDYWSSDNSWSEMTNYNRTALDAHWGIETTYDFYLNKFGRNSYDNNGAQLISKVNKPSYLNAAWLSGDAIMVYGVDTINSIPYVDLDVTAHEFTHAVTGATSLLIGFGESGALNEGLSDVFAVCVENEAKPNNGSLIWVIGENIQVGGFRSLSNPTCKFYRGIGWSVSEEEHINCGVFGYWFYLLANGGSGTTQTGINYNVTGIGLEKAIRICYLMNCSYLTWTSVYRDARNCSYLAAAQLGYTEDIEQIRNAWIAVGLDFPSSVDIEGSFVLCGTTDFSVGNLPPEYDVRWQLRGNDLQNFSISTDGNQCSVTPSVTNDYNEAEIRATIRYHGYIVKTISRNIYTHNSSLYVEGYQDFYINGSTSYPEQTFQWVVPTAVSGYSSNDILINTDCDIRLTSTRFKGMNIRFQGGLCPTNMVHNDSCVTFHTSPIILLPPNTSEYSLTMEVSTEEGCRDFSLNFIVSDINDHDSELVINVSNNTLYASLFAAVPDPIGGGLYQQAVWSLYVIKAQSGQTVKSKVVTGTSTTVSLNGLSSGIYIVRAVYKGNTYTNKFLK